MCRGPECRRVSGWRNDNFVRGAQAERVWSTLMQMKKIEIAPLEAVAEGV